MFKLFRPAIHYTELQRLQDAAYPIVPTLWHGRQILVQIRMLSATQLHGIGNMSLIETFADKIARSKQPTVSEINEYVERQHRILEACMVCPTYQEALDAAGAHINKATIEAELAEIKRLYDLLPSGKEKADLKIRYDRAELLGKLILPTDFVVPIIGYVTGATTTDIKKVTEEMLLQAAVLAQRGGDNPADHVSGVFERPGVPGDTYLRDDINTRAWVLLDEHVAEKRGKK